MDRLANRVALVTGANRGIGYETAMALARAGADVVVNYRSHVKEAEEVVGHIRDLGRRSVAIPADVSVAEEVARLMEAAEREVGEISILVNNAGVVRRQPPEEITEQDWDDLLRVNLKSAFLVSQRVLPKMREKRWGRIINISSVAAQTGGVVGPHYAASKAGMIGMSHFYAAMLAKEGITVNVVAPALIETAMIEDLPESAKDHIPVGRFGKSDEVAEVVVMLARNGYITGQTINVNGGWYMT